LNYSKIFKCDTNNGDGFRISLFVSGCTLHCKNCQNKIAQDFNYGKLYTKETEEEIIKYLYRPYIKGLSLLGGEIFDNLKSGELLDLVKRAKELYPNKTIFLLPIKSATNPDIN
jgi:anaerobic ribonucleoside-triphosphate reductase activating protein